MWNFLPYPSFKPEVFIRIWISSHFHQRSALRLSRTITFRNSKVGNPKPKKRDIGWHRYTPTSSFLDFGNVAAFPLPPVPTPPRWTSCWTSQAMPHHPVWRIRYPSGRRPAQKLRKLAAQKKYPQKQTNRSWKLSKKLRSLCTCLCKYMIDVMYG